jgi:hypothetical protein
MNANAFRNAGHALIFNLVSTALRQSTMRGANSQLHVTDLAKVSNPGG